MQNILLKLLLSIVFALEVRGFRCDRRPYGTTSLSSAPDGRFRLTVLGTDNTYIPNQLYKVQITERDGQSHFIGFMISAEGDTRPDPRNPRRTVSQFPGELSPADPMTAKFSDRCLGSVEQASSLSKTAVEVDWRSPPPGNGCVTLRAMVAENEDTWYSDGAPLTQRLCEDLRQPDDAAPQINGNCEACGEAKYEVEFTGMWSRNTHPQQYPENDWVPRYSDLVGASHGAGFVLWAPGELVSEGFRDLVEFANASKLEGEIIAKIGNDVRTLIKAKGLSYPKTNNPTHAIFRADRTHHLVTVAAALAPSPDWFLGVTRFELCQEDNTWLPDRELYLFPWDAGTDNGVSYESPKTLTFPQGAVSRVDLNSHDRNSPFFELDIRDLHPFGKLNLRLIRTYHDQCEETTVAPSAETSTEESKEEEAGGPEEPSRYSGRDEGEEPIAEKPNPFDECPMSEWQHWSPCEGQCRAGVVRGYMWRERFHLVDGLPLEKYDTGSNWRTAKKEVPQKCKDEKNDFEQKPCEERCNQERKDDQPLTVGRRVMTHIAPGKTWSKKRDVEQTVSN
ncbi:spondin-2 [Amyelois transitella]|uniref:spondin-2 n=1 Tax=Amyelois transitella TaxID=680683 RepID=UPI0029902E2D|nr:spondin-2 [Amyelois transitella]